MVGQQIFDTGGADIDWGSGSHSRHEYIGNVYPSQPRRIGSSSLDKFPTEVDSIVGGGTNNEYGLLKQKNSAPRTHNPRYPVQTHILTAT